MTTQRWEEYQDSIVRYPELGFSLDISRMDAPDQLTDNLSEEIARAYQDRIALENGETVNQDENRAVGHYWLRNPDCASEEVGKWIRKVKADVVEFARKIHQGEILTSRNSTFRHILLIGIGGSALGPQLVSRALQSPNSPIDLHFLDNTDPEGIDDVLDGLGQELVDTLVIVTSKSGGTAETRNGMLETEAKFRSIGLNFAGQAVAVTGEGSVLDQHAESNGWLKRFPMADWIGGRTSVMSAVGLLPAALIGLDVEEFLAGAAAMDERTRSEDTSDNAAMCLALMWHFAGNGHGSKDMVILPYCDRLDLMSRYLQQLVMESLGKEFELGNKKVVNQGIAVYGNKGSTDQHAYVQQLRDGLGNFFVTFIEVQKTREGDSIIVDGFGSTTGDFLQGFLRGTRDALYEKNRPSITISISELNERSLGAIIALFERAVSYYASLIHVNAYHQPGVEAGKRAAGDFIDMLSQVKQHMTETGSEGFDAAQMASNLGESDIEKVYHCLNHLSGIGFCRRETGTNPGEDRFFC